MGVYLCGSADDSSCAVVAGPKLRLDHGVHDLLRRSRLLRQILFVNEHEAAGVVAPHVASKAQHPADAVDLGRAALKGSATMHPAIWPDARAGTMSAGDISDKAASSGPEVPMVTTVSPLSRSRRCSTTVWIRWPGLT